MSENLFNIPDELLDKFIDEIKAGGGADKTPFSNLTFPERIERLWPEYFERDMKPDDKSET